MKNLPTEKDVPTVDDNPVWNPKREQHMHDPVEWGLTLSKALARSDNRTLPGTSALSKNCWTVRKLA